MGLEILDGLSTGLWCLLKLSLSRRLVSAVLCLEPKHFHCIRSIRNCKTICHRFGFIQ